jgi:antitoxin (DNA-binding transcriptional repressor) of toxin-antitoxin stability system
VEASIVDLRYRMKDVLRALERNEEVTVLYRGRKKGVIVPEKTTLKAKVAEHPFFGMAGDNERSVARHMDALRSSRY